ncbi:MAG: aspartate kinase, partial [bacterium]
MNIIVCKFGGSSLATAEKVENVANILAQNPERKCIVVSAPGKAHGNDTKITDLLIGIVKKSLNGANAEPDVEEVRKRYADIYVPLGISQTRVNKILADLQKRVGADKSDADKYRDAIVASGEDYNARLFAEFLTARGALAEYVSPLEAGLIVSSHFGNAMYLRDQSDKLCSLKKRFDHAAVVFPGFFGATAEGDIATFSRGGSDLTGAILADAVDASEYENWTDVDGIFSANPKIIPSPAQIKCLTYREMRELSYMGFNVFHEDAVTPVIRKKIPIRLRNTNNTANPGTLISSSRQLDSRSVIGISCKGQFCCFF